MTFTVDTPLKAALTYARLGWPVVPLFTPANGGCDCPDVYKKGLLVRPGGPLCKSPGKHPRSEHGLDDASTDPQKIERWWKIWPHANIGVDLVRAGLVDIAPDSVEWHAEFIARGLPSTASFRSGGGDGHEHHLYQRPETCPAHRLCKTDEYDILSAGYACMPPSLHASGRRYEWEHEPDAVGSPPGWAVAMLQDAVRSVHHLNGENGVVHVTGPEPPVKLFGTDLETWAGQHPRVKANGVVERSGSLWDIGCALARAGASRSTIAAALQNRDETLGWSKYTGRRDAATRYAVLADHVLSGEGPRIRLKPVVTAPPAADPSVRRFRFITADELKNRPDPTWLLDNVLQRDTLALLVGAQETLKTFTALDMALGSSTGIGWQGHPVMTPGPALYVSSEGGSGIGLRVSAWETFHGVDVGDRCLFLADQAPQFLDRRDGGDVDELLLSIKDLTVPPVLIVIDTAARSMVGADENSAQDIGLFIASADRIRQETGAVMLLVHHFNKGGTARGSTALLGAVHTIIETSRESESKVVVLKCGKQKDAEHFEMLTLESQTVLLGANEQTGVVRTSLVLTRAHGITVEPKGPPLFPASLQALATLIDLKDASFAQWRDAANLAKTTFLRAKAQLINGGYVAHVVDRYHPTSDGFSVGSTRVRGRSMDLMDPSPEDEGPRVHGGGSTEGPLREGPVDPRGSSDPLRVETTDRGDDLPW